LTCSAVSSPALNSSSSASRRPAGLWSGTMALTTRWSQAASSGDSSSYSANEGFGHAPEGFGQAPEGFGHAPEGFGQAPEGFGQAPEGFGHAPEGFGHAPLAPVATLVRDSTESSTDAGAHASPVISSESRNRTQHAAWPR
jgi:hypothetical protein